MYIPEWLLHMGHGFHGLHQKPTQVLEMGENMCDVT